MTTLFPQPQVASSGYARIAVERGVDRYPDGLTYSVPEALADLSPGDRVVVPLGRGNTPTAGYVVERVESIDRDPGQIKSILRRDDSAATLPPQLLELARWMSSYYCAPIGMTLATMLPAAVKRNIGTKANVMIDLGDPLPLEEKLPPKQRAVLELLAGLPAGERPVMIRDLADRAGLRTTGPIKRLLERGLVESSLKSQVEAAWVTHATDATAPEKLTDEQDTIVSQISAALPEGFSTHLIYGVTGSGKTEIYISLIKKVVARGKSALVLVPEISLTPQTGGRLMGRFPGRRVAVLHSKLTAAQRHQQWDLAARGVADIVLGARSAVFAPIPDEKLGLIVVDEEHDSSYKQDQTPRYHGRDVAVRRGQLARCPVVLGSATPSLESWQNAAVKGTYHLHTLDDRVPGMRLPTVKVVDFREEQRRRGDRRVHLIGPTLEHALRRTLDAGGQALILLNRRGYANYIACPDVLCGWVMTCDQCDVTMVYHKNRPLPTGTAAGGYVQCHHCLAEQRLPERCPDCGRKVIPFGLGTQRVEEELSRTFAPLLDGETMLRLDSDSMLRAEDLHGALERFGAGAVKVLLGTQMIAKGLDYPGVRLVGVINADTSINLPDFRASERTFQLVNQVAGRSGRSAEPGLVVVQSFQPETPAIRLAAAHDYRGFAAAELADRERSGLPPSSRMARIVLRHEDHAECQSRAVHLAERLRSLAEESTRIRGPAPCPISRLAGRHRQQVEIFCRTAAGLQGFLTAARRAGWIKAGREMVIDVDPIALL